MKMRLPVPLFFLLLLTTLTTSSSAQSTLFTLLSPKETNVSFINKVVESDSLHVMNYEYLYNGSGIGVADFNGDGLLDIFISGNAVSNKLFLNKGNFRFEDITIAAGVKGNGTWSTGVSIADVNGDGLLDVYVCHSGKYTGKKLSNELFINQGLKNGIPVFKESAYAYGLDAEGTHSTQAVFFDYDRDGDLDMFLLNHSNHSYNPLLNTRNIRATPNMDFGNRLFKNDTKNGQPSFTDVTLAAGIVNNALNFGLSVTISDLNGDGWPDIYTTSDYTEQDYLYINNRDGTFKETIKAAMAHISKYAMGADIADYNNDGRPDIVTLDMLPEDNRRQKMLKGPDEYDMYHLLLDSGYHHQQMRNMLQLNQGVLADGNLHFSEIGQLAGFAATDWSWAALLADFDNDGWKDLFVSNGYLRDFTDMDFLKYTVASTQMEELKRGVTDFKTYDLVKKMPANKLGNYIFKNKGDLTFIDKSDEWGINLPAVSNSAVYADLDNDGDLDLIVNNINDPVMLYRNNAEMKNNNFLRIKLLGSGSNTAAIGAKVYVKAGDLQQLQEKQVIRGYQSSVDPVLLFGLGKNEIITEIKVIWPDGRESRVNNVGANQLLTLKQDEAQSKTTAAKPAKPLFTDITQKIKLDYKHVENDFIDFKGEPLMPYQLSRMGPALAKADVNNDGLEDIYIGGAMGQSGKLFLGKADGTFLLSGTQPWLQDAASEDVNALFFDANQDGYPDLWVVSGGNEYNDGAPEFQDRLYVNDGKGNYIKAQGALPAMLNSKQAIAVGDFDKDGDLDVFIGGMGLPGSFPLSSRSWLLRNDTKNAQIKFTDVTEEYSTELLNPGMVTTAVWQDVDGDGATELLIAGHWMPIKLFKYINGRFVDQSQQAGLGHTEGLWNVLVPMDSRGDGRVDFIAGNHGLNNQFKASVYEPVTIYADDFNNDGALDPILSYFIQGKNYPYASRDELLDQIVQMKKRFVKYADYANITLDDLLTKEQISKAKKFNCVELSSCILENDGKGNFVVKALPVQAQFSAVYGALFDDFDGDGQRDLLLAGNFYPNRVQFGSLDASLGLFLKGTGNRNFLPVDNQSVGLFISGDVRGLLQLPSKRMVIVPKNNDSVQVIAY